MDKSAWKSKTHKIPTPWGHEIVWDALPSIRGKALFIRKGERTSLKYHTTKDEVFYIMSGMAKIQYADEKWHYRKNYPFTYDNFITGDCLTVQANCPYRIEAVEDCTILEIGNQRIGKTVRLEDDYGREVPEVIRSA
jgi:mannose-6-phosphate isomerase-like protein (cupin superfamily)